MNDKKIKCLFVQMSCTAHGCISSCAMRIWSKPSNSCFSNILVILRSTPKLLPFKDFSQNVIILTLNYEEYIS